MKMVICIFYKPFKNQPVLKNIVYCCLTILATAILACTVPKIQVDNNLLENTSIYEVKGRNGWLINQTLSFGKYQTGKVNRSWIKGYDIPFIIRFTGAKEKLSFSLQDGSGNKSEVFCLGVLNEQELLLFHEYFDITIKTKDAFTGSVALNESTAFDFFVVNLNQNNWFKEATGLIHGNNMEIEIRPVKNLSNGQKMLTAQVPGFEFVLDGKVVAALETLNKGKIWIKNSLDEQQKLVLASVASALLLRSELADHND